MARPRLVIDKVMQDGEVRFKWRLIANGNVIAGDEGQGYNRRHRAREMGERVASGDYGDYVLVEP